MINCVIKENVIRILDDQTEILAMYEVLTDEKNKLVTLSIEGNLRSDAVVYIEDELYSMVTVGAHITVDINKVNYISTAAQQTFLKIQQKVESLGAGSVTFLMSAEKVYSEFVKTGLAELLMIER